MPWISCFLAGFLLAAFHAQQVFDKQPAQQWLNRDVVITGTVVGLPEHNAKRLRFKLRGETYTDIDTGASQDASGALLRLSWYQNPPALSAGERLRLVVKLRAPNGFMNPGGFDYEKWLFQNRIVATGYVREAESAERMGVAQSPAMWLQRGRLWLKQRLLTATEHRQHGALIMALAIGDRSAIDQQQWQRFIDTGTNHLLAISGLHISLVGAFAGLLAATVWRFSTLVQIIPRAPFILCSSAFAALCYAGLAGFSVPTQRALLMFSTLAVLSIVARHQPRHSALALALLVVCLLNPLVVLSAGFWMSFAAVAILFVVYSFIPRAAFRDRVSAVLRGHLLITIGMYPLGLLFFGQMSLVAPLANFIAVPVVGMLLTPIIFCASLVAMINTAMAALLFVPVDWILQMVDWYLGVQSRWEFALVQLGVINSGVLLLSVAIAVVTLLPLLPRIRWLGGVLLLPLFWSAADAPSTGDYSVTFLDVGQGTAVVVQTRHHTLVYDTGPQFSASFNAADAVILPYLQSQGISKVDHLIVSHSDRDHIGGAAELVQGIRVDKVSVSEASDELPGAGNCTTGMTWQWDAVSFEILHPSATDTGSENDRSCVLLVSTANAKHTLLAGDVESAGENKLLQRGLPAVELLLAPHHGSNTSSTALFVHVTRPRHVVHTVGYQNRYSFPHKKVVQRYYDSQQYQTAESGATSFLISDHKDTQVSEYRRDNPHLWSRKS